jgi:ubiquitin
MNPVGWNPCEKVFAKGKKKRDMFAGVLQRHKQFLKNLEA